MFRKAVISVFFCILCCIPAVSQNVVDAGSEGGCIPVLSVSEDSLAYRSGERFSFTIHYEWGAIDSDVGWASVSLDTVRFNGERAFHCFIAAQVLRGALSFQLCFSFPGRLAGEVPTALQEEQAVFSFLPIKPGLNRV